jgi:hypothetical protein
MKRILLLLAVLASSLAVTASSSANVYATWGVQTNHPYSLVRACNTATGECGISRTNGSGFTWFYTTLGEDTYYEYAYVCDGGSWFQSGTQWFQPMYVNTINHYLSFQRGCY